MILKKACSILLLLVFLFNAVGYKVVFFYLEQQADIRLEMKIKTLHDADKQLITVKIPINLPYQTDWREFESIDGEMTYKGKTYKYVKRKVLRDTLILVCIDHREKSQIEKRSSDYFKKVNDLASENNKKPQLKLAKMDYYQEVTDRFLGLPGFNIIQQNQFAYPTQIAYGFPSKFKMPPRKQTA